MTSKPRFYERHLTELVPRIRHLFRIETFIRRFSISRQLHDDIFICGNIVFVLTNTSHHSLLFDEKCILFMIRARSLFKFQTGKAFILMHFIEMHSSSTVLLLAAFPCLSAGFDAFILQAHFCWYSDPTCIAKSLHKNSVINFIKLSCKITCENLTFFAKVKLVYYHINRLILFSE